MVETLNASKEFEQKPSREIERKYLPLFPESLLELRKESTPIEQFYVSHPSEPYSLRFREILEDGELHYQATLKDRGTVTEQGLDRIEIEIDISPELYHYYKSPETPCLRKLRTSINKHVAIDFYDDGYVHVESEHPIAWTNFIEQYGSNFVDITGDKIANNEWRAYIEYRRQNNGKEPLTPQAELSTDRIVADIVRAHSKAHRVVVQITGRSGSGKSTIVRELQTKLATQKIASTTLSTDDYHRGASWLRQYNNGHDWTEWDHPVVYDVAEMARDVRALQAGHPIARRTIDFSSCEPIYSESILPTPVIIVEGIYASSPEFTQFDALRYDMPTPLVTCIGRRLLRDLNERPEFSDPKKSLRYILEQAEPYFRRQK